jgi:hypothetical protein
LEEAKRDRQTGPRSGNAVGYGGHCRGYNINPPQRDRHAILPVMQHLSQAGVDNGDMTRAMQPDCHPRSIERRREISMKYGLLWLLGVPIPILIIAWLLFH